jgi:hypothetical protein
MVAMLLSGCRGGGGGSAGPAPVAEGSENPCNNKDLQDARRLLLEKAALPPRRPPPPETVRGETVQRGDGYTIRALDWPHGGVPGDLAHALLLLPEPLPAAALPLLLHFSGHWDAWAESEEVLFGAELMARQGWAVLALPPRGGEAGDATPPAWRAAHFDAGLYGELRLRRGGSTPLAWDLVAAGGALDAALASPLALGAAVDPSRVAVMGASGGADRAAALAAADPRVAAAVLGAWEYSFGTDDGTAGCSCGALRDGSLHRARWLALAACRPGAPPRPRPLLGWDARPERGDAAALRALAPRHGAIEVRDVPDTHGMTRPMAAASWAFLERSLGIAARGAEDEDRARAAMRDAWQPADTGLRPAFPPGTPGPAAIEQGLPPWRGDARVRPDALRRMLGLVDAEGTPRDPGEGMPGLDGLRLEASGAGPAAWIGVEDPGAPSAEPPLRDPTGPVAALARTLVYLRIPSNSESLHRLVRRSVEVGPPLLGVAVHDLLSAHEVLRARSGVDPARIGWIARGAAAVPTLWAAVLLGGEGGPAILVDAPVTLWFDGPQGPEADPSRVAPWPPWLLAPVPSGASLDPWPAARLLGDRVRWVRPLGGDGRPWERALPSGGLAEDVAAALRDPPPGRAPLPPRPASDCARTSRSSPCSSSSTPSWEPWSAWSAASCRSWESRSSSSSLAPPSCRSSPSSA